MPRRWIKWIAVILGVAGMLTPALIELGWIPENQAQKAVIFLLGFIVLEGATGDSDGSDHPELLTSSEGYYHAQSGLISETKHELIGIVHGQEISAEQAQTFVRKMLSTLRSEKQMHTYEIVAARIGELSDESFQRRFAIERDPSLEGRFHYRVIDSPISFGCQVFDQKHWSIDFPANPADPKGGAIIFRNHPEGARMVSGFPPSMAGAAGSDDEP